MSIPTNLNPLGRERLVIPTDGLMFYHDLANLKTIDNIGNVCSIVGDSGSLITTTINNIPCIQTTNQLGYIECPSFVYPNRAVTARTFSVWFYCNNVVKWSGQPMLFGYSNSNGSLGVGFFVKESYDLRACQYTFTDMPSLIDLSNVNNMNKWLHFVYYLHQNGGAPAKCYKKVWINGSVVYEQNFSSNIATNGILKIGKTSAIRSTFGIAKARLYNRELTDKEVKALYKELKPIY